MKKKAFTSSQGGPEKQAPGQTEYSFSLWKKVLCGVAAFMICVGTGVLLFSGSSDAVPEEGAGGGSAGRTGFRTGLMPDNGGVTQPDSFPRTNKGDSQDNISQESPWGPALLRGGVGFLIGFGIGYALRMLLRISLVFCGFLMLVMVVFSYIGWVEVNWETIQGNLEQWGQVAQEEFSNFKTFVLGTLPSAALGGLGLFSGFKKK